MESESEGPRLCAETGFPWGWGRKGRRQWDMKAGGKKRRGSKPGEEQFRREVMEERRGRRRQRINMHEMTNFNLSM